MSGSSPVASTAQACLDRWYGLLPLVMLGVGTLLAVATQPFLGPRLAGYPAMAVLVPVTAALIWWWERGGGRGRQAGRASYWWVRTGLAFTLTLVNPLFGFFAFAGYVDLEDVLRGWRRRLGLVAVAVTLAGTHAGGLPATSAGQWLLFAVLTVLNIAVAGVLLQFSVIQQSISESRAATIGELEAALERNEALAATVAAQERDAGVQQERQRLAAEIHDTIAQGLAGVVAQLRAARELADPVEAAAHLDRAEALARDSLVEARRSVHDLAPGALAERSLPDALRRLVEGWDRSHETAARLTVTGDHDALHPEVEATVVRLVQESLTNVSRHARASRVAVTLTYTEAELLLDVRDDGVGFDPAATPTSASFGLRGMRQRAERVAGRLAIESEPGHGTAVSAQLPAVWRAPVEPDRVPTGGPR